MSFLVIRNDIAISRSISIISRNQHDNKKPSSPFFCRQHMGSSSALGNQNKGSKSKGGHERSPISMCSTDPETSSENSSDSIHIHQDESFNRLLKDSNITLDEMTKSWGVSVPLFTSILDTKVPLSLKRLESVPDAVLISQSWNKVLAFRSMFAEALIGRWRMLSAVDEIQKKLFEKQPSQFFNKNHLDASLSSSFPHHHSTIPAYVCPVSGDSFEVQALRMVERNLDPLAKSFDTRIVDLEVLVIGTLDAAVRYLCPHHQVVQREAYRPLMGSSDCDPEISRAFFHEDECITLEDNCSLFARYGVEPRFWLIFCEAFMWAMKGHNPYSIDDEKNDLYEATNKSAHGKFIAGMVALPMIEAALHRASYVRRNVFQELKICCSVQSMEARFESIGVHMFEQLFHDFPELADHFSQPDIEEMSLEIFELICAIVQQGSSDELSDSESNLRILLKKQSMKWTELQLPIEMFSVMGKGILEAVQPLFVGRNESIEKLKSSLAFLFREAMQFVLHPVLLLQNLRSEASKFYEEIAKEFNWSPELLQKRLFEVFREISIYGQYTHTVEELEIGCRLAWRNSAKCIGRIAWDTLVVRDRRHCTRPNEIFNEVVEHLKLATDGTSIQSVMTVFRPQQFNEIWGIRFWTSQCVRYAGYKDSESGEILGDIANADFTSYLIEQKLWTPPVEKCAFDVLPLVIKLPGNDIPFVYELPKAVTHDIHIEHPKFNKVKDLGYKWTAIPVINNFSLTVGGIHYTAAPFNGWFMTTEIARNLLERYGATKPLAIAMGLDLTDKLLAPKVSAELESAILYSFEKGKTTVVDPETVGHSFVTHCKREQSAGRECPAQWSWIGGLVGPTNPAWHLEMRDFYKTPRFNYCCDPWQVVDLRGNNGQDKIKVDTTDQILLEKESQKLRFSMPKVLIAYGSETGTAESIATSLARLLKVCRPSVLTLNEVSDLMNQQMMEYTHIIIICSTFGDGKPPTNAFKFFDSELKGKVTVDMQFSVLALGSSLYLTNFCKAGKNIHHKMEAAGARQMNNVTCVDAAQGRQHTALNWCSLIKKDILPESLTSQVESSMIAPASYKIRWNVENRSSQERSPKKEGMRCIGNKELFEDGDISNRSTRHIELELPKDVVYQAGDHISITPVNNIDMVSRFCRCFAHELESIAAKSEHSRTSSESSVTNTPRTASPSWQLQMYKSFNVECVENDRTTLHPAKYLSNNNTLFEVLQLHVDFSFTAVSYVVDLLSFISMKLQNKAASTPKLGLAGYFVRIAKDAVEEYYQSGESTKLDAIVEKYPTIVHFLERFGSSFCEPKPNMQPVLKLVDVLTLMHRVKPRQYSISSSDMTSPGRLSLTVGVLNYYNRVGIAVKGLCSHYLAGLRPGDTVNAKVIESSFKPPSSTTCPIIMIGAGTGLAPFMAFLRDRALAMTSAQPCDYEHEHAGTTFGECHLFFGCRSDKEILYKDQLMEWDSSGVMQLHLAQSRQTGKPKQYVQDCLGDDPTRKKIALLLSKPETHVYICGDASMAKSSFEVCIEVLQKYWNMSKIAATTHISSMHLNDHWQYDVWSQSNQLDLGIKNGIDISERLVNESRRSMIGDFSGHSLDNIDS